MLKNIIIVKSNHTPKEKTIATILHLIVILILSFIITFITFCFSSKFIDLSLIKTYFQSPLLLILNVIPVFIFISLIYVISGRLWLGYSITSIIFVD